MTHFRLSLIALFCLTVPGLAAADEEDRIFPRKIDCNTTSEPRNCKAHQRLMPMIAGGALGGRKASMRAVARYAGEFANGIFVQDIELSCAWRMVIVDSPKIRSTPEDQSAMRKTCAPLSAGNYADALAIARLITHRVFRTSVLISEKPSGDTLTPAERRARSGR